MLWSARRTAGADAVSGSFTACRNAAESARVYTVDPLDHLRAERAAEAAGWEIVGVVHSHTHTEPYPSPTDIAQAPDPGWHYVIVGSSGRARAPQLPHRRRGVTEEPVVGRLTRKRARRAPRRDRLLRIGSDLFRF